MFPGPLPAHSTLPWQIRRAFVLTSAYGHWLPSQLRNSFERVAQPRPARISDACFSSQCDSPGRTDRRPPFPVSLAAPIPRFGATMAQVMSDLASKFCVPCRGGVPPLKGEELASFEKRVDGWSAIDEHHITKLFKFTNFRERSEERRVGKECSAWWGARVAKSEVVK